MSCNLMWPKDKIKMKIKLMEGIHYKNSLKIRKYWISFYLAIIVYDKFFYKKYY